MTIGTAGFIQCSGLLIIINHGPTLYNNLGFSETKQLLYPAAWPTFALGLCCMAFVMVDHFSRPKLMAIGVFGCMVTLVIEAALIAQFVPSNNSAAF